MKTSLLLCVSLLVIISCVSVCKDAHRTSKRSVFDTIERNKKGARTYGIANSNTTYFRVVTSHTTVIKYDYIRNLFYKNIEEKEHQVLKNRKRKEKIKTHFKEGQKRMKRRKKHLLINLSFLTKMKK